MNNQLFVLRISTWNNNFLLKIIISFLKPHKGVQINDYD